LTRKKKRIVIPPGSTTTTEDDTTTNDADDVNIINQRECPICHGIGHLPIKVKYLQSQNALGGVITSRRRRPLEWKEFGHIPPTVQTMLDIEWKNGIIDTNTSMDGNNYSSESMSESEMTYHHAALYLLYQANGQDDDYNTQRKDIPVIIDKTSIIPPSSSSLVSSIIHNKLLPSWLPTNPGEQLCNLVGRWRILQCVASHRWTTDDLVTAYIASITFFTHQTTTLMNNNNTTTNTAAEETFNNNNNDHKRDDTRKRTVRYLDLGCGNASVLQMVTWYLLSQDSNEKYYNKVQAVGVEARNEAVGLARRSLLFNLGQADGWMPSSTTYDTSSHNRIDHDVQVVHGDFRDLIFISLKNNNDEDSPTKAEGHKQDDTPNNLEGIALQRYDIITGTPPYFRVGFTTSSIDNSSVGDDGSKHKNDTMKISAIIQQGGMPTSQQSAPARCEFRGGIEAYCQTASALIHPQHGIFVVCENWLNNHRVWAGAKDAGLIIVCVYPVRGSVRKETNLFAVYVMKKKKKKQKHDDKTIGVEDDEEQQDEAKIIRPPLAVRDEDGKWTDEYTKVLNAMSIPVV
jgi:tRNA1(Val) A37 N6-methylase TrmN6